jgi:2-aminobenzoate-CoA ligase
LGCLQRLYERRTYKELTDWSNRLAHALVENYGIKPGNRILIRSGNNPALVAAWLAATKAGAVVVNTMPMLRASDRSPRSSAKPAA